MSERCLPKSICPSRLMMRDGMGDFVRLFRQSARVLKVPDLAHSDAEPQNVVAFMEANPDAIAAMLLSSSPEVFVDDARFLTASAPPRLAVEFETLSDEVASILNSDVNTPGVPDTTKPTRAMTLIGSAAYAAHTNFKWITTNAEKNYRDYRGVRRTLTQLERIPNIAHVHFISPHALFFSIPKLLRKQAASILDEVEFVLKEGVEYIWQQWTVPLIVEGFGP